MFGRTELSTLVNIGETIERRLNAIGVYSREDLEQVGPVEAWRKIKHKFPTHNLSPNYYLYSLYGALIDVRRTQLPQTIKAKLQSYF